MKKKLVIAEKPSVAQMIAKVLNATKKGDGYLEGEEYIVTWCFGHLLKIKEDEANAKWTLEGLPIIPARWEYEAIDNATAKKQLYKIHELIRRDDVVSLVCATDAGREGELIFRLVYNSSGTKKKTERLWISSLEEPTIKEGFNHLRDDKEFDNLYKSALSRSHADWIVGVNATRYYTLGYGEDRTPMSVGRVQTPTLNMIVKRQEEIDSFKKEKRWVIVKDFGSWKLESDKISKEEEAVEALKKTEKKPVVITKLEKENKKNYPPLLYSLTTLQQDANRFFSLSAQETLDLMQSLYEKRILSYPRTDSSYITSDMEESFTKIVYRLRDRFLPELKVSWVKRLVDNSKVSDHYAVILTNQGCSDLRFSNCTQNELKILKLVVARMLSAVSPVYEWEETKVEALTEGILFKASGRKELVGGWKATERILFKKPESEGNIFPSDIAVNAQYTGDKTRLEERESKPPLPYTENTLLGAMDRAGSEDMPDDAERKGIGTSATRAGIIERLLTVGYIERRKLKPSSKVFYLFPTDKGKRLIELVSPRLKDVKTTADWEWRLKDIEKGMGDCNLFLSDISNEISETVVVDEELLEHEKDRGAIVLGRCPVCGSPVVEHMYYAACTNEECKMQLYKKSNILFGHTLTIEEMKDLFHGKKVKLRLKSKSKGNFYTALVSLKKENNNNSRYYYFDFEFENKAKGKTESKKKEQDGV